MGQVAWAGRESLWRQPPSFDYLLTYRCFFFDDHRGWPTAGGAAQGCRLRTSPRPAVARCRQPAAHLPSPGTRGPDRVLGPAQGRGYRWTAAPPAAPWYRDLDRFLSRAVPGRTSMPEPPRAWTPTSSDSRRGAQPGSAAISSYVPAVIFQHRPLAGPRLPALNDHVTVLRVELHQPRLAAGFSQAISVEPDPPKGSSTMSRLLLEFLTARSTSATGFIVGCRSFLAGLSMNHTSP